MFPELGPGYYYIRGYLQRMWNPDKNEELSLFEQKKYGRKFLLSLEKHLDRLDTDSRNFPINDEDIKEELTELFEVDDPSGITVERGGVWLHYNCGETKRLLEDEEIFKGENTIAYIVLTNHLG